jgi:hypothetical protein
MTDNLAHELARLPRLGVADLRRRYADLFGETISTGNRAWLLKRLAWRLQSLAEGDLSERARQRAATLAHDADLRLSPPRPRRLRPQTDRPGGPAIVTTVSLPPA